MVKVVANIRKIKKIPFVSASFFGALSSIIKILATLVIGKIIAVRSGAEGIAQYGQLLNFVTILVILAGGSITEGVTKYVAQYKQDNQALRQLLSTSLRYILLSSLFVGASILIFSKYIALELLHEESLSFIFQIFGITIVFYVLNNFILAIVSGYKDYKKYNKITIYINILSLLITIVMLYFFDLNGALVAIVLNQSLLFFFSVALLRKEIWFSVANFVYGIDKRMLRLLLGFALLSLLTTAITPIITIFIRDLISGNISLKAAGYYEFASRISTTTLLFFSLSVTTYYLPRISEITNRSELLKEIKNTYKIVLPVMLIMLSGIYFLRYIIIDILATADFYESAALFLFLLTGVFFKISAQICGFVFLAKAKIRILITLEVLLNVVYALLSYLMIKKFGLIGSGYAFMLYNLIYLATVLLIFRKLYVTTKNEEC